MNRFYIFLLCLLFTNPVLARQFTVNENGGLKSIDEALKLCGRGDTIFVYPGIYREPNLLVNKPVTIIGLDYPVVENLEQDEIFTIESDSVKISGLQLQNVKTSYTKDLAAVKVNRQKHCHFENNRLKNTFFGIFLKHSNNCVIRNNRIVGRATDEMSSGNAIHLWYCRNIQIENNEAMNHRDGIYLEFVDSSRVVGNLVEGNIRYGLHFMFSDHDQYIRNTFRKNGAGVAVMFSRFINMEYNTFEHNWGSASYGLLLKDITDSRIIRNRFIRNTVGIYAEGSNRVEVIGNRFEQNGWALKIYGSSMYNRFHQNNFLNNSFELSVAGKSETNNFDGNYWSQYTGYDLDKNGVGDVPYRPVKLFSRIIGDVSSSSILMRSLLIDVINFAEKVSPVLTPDNLMDRHPLMKKLKYDSDSEPL